MHNRFMPRYQSYSTEKLISILAKRREYQREAVEAAECVIAERRVPTDTFISLLDRQEAMLEEIAWKESRRSGQPLSVFERTFILSLPLFGLFGGIIAYMHYEKEGYALKARQAAQLVGIGFILWSVLFFFLSRIW